MIFDAADTEARKNYQLLNGGVTPRPIAWISTRSRDGVDNLAPYSFFSVASCNPPVLLYTQVTQRSGVDKDTLKNLVDTGECVVNIVSARLLDQANKCSAGIDASESEFDFASVESTASYKVSPRSVKASPVRYECSLKEVISISKLPAGGTVVLLDVKAIYVDDNVYIDNAIDQTLLDSVGKMGGDLYSYTSTQVALERP